LPSGNSLNGVWALSQSHVIVVGDLGVIYRWKNQQWENGHNVVTGDARLNAVWFSAPENGWIASNDGMFLWEGIEWENHLPGSEFVAVWGTGPSNVWACGNDGVYHWDGFSWTNRDARACNTIFGLDTSHVWAGAGSEIRIFDGTTWTVAVSLPADSAVSGIWASSESDVWATYYEDASNSRVVHFDGTAWAMPGSTLGVSGAALWGDGTNIWACGPDGIVDNSSDWDTISTAQGDCNDLHGAQDGDVWAVGSGNSIMHYSSGEWISMGTLGPNATFVGVSGDTPSGYVVAVGSTLTLENRNGTWWFNPGMQGAWKGVYACSSTDVWLVGDTGVYRWDGSSLTKIVGLAAFSAYAISGTSCNRVWIGGSDNNLPQVAWWDGTSWQIESVSLPPSDPIAAIWVGASDTDVWILSESGGVMTRTGPNAWSQHLNMLASGLDVHGSIGGDVWIVGKDASGNALALQRNGGGFASHDLPGTVNAVYARSSTEVWAAGDNGLMLVWNAGDWTTRESGATVAFMDFWFAGDNAAWVVGTDKAILRTP
jgi:hypothetical protein